MPEYRVCKKGNVPDGYIEVKEYAKVTIDSNIVNDKRLKESIRIGDNVLAVKKELPKPDVKTEVKPEVKPVDENKK